MSESQFAEALHTALDEETAGLTLRPDAAHRARRQGRRRKATRALLAAVPAVALVAGGAVLAAAHSTGTASPAATHPAVLTAAYVTKKAEAALSTSNVDNYIIESNTTIDGLSSTYWYDPVTGDMQQVQKSANDTVTTWDTAEKVGSHQYVKQTIVDAAAKTVTTYTFSGFSVDPAVSPSALKLALSAGQPLAAVGDGSSQIVVAGRATIVGKSVINGQSAIDLQVDSPDVSCSTPKTPGVLYTCGTIPSGQSVAPGHSLYNDYWVNAQTFQVVKRVTQAGTARVVTDYQWLPRTKSVLAQVNTPQIPAGYRLINKGTGY